MDTYPVSLALVDFLPNMAFLIGAYFLVKTALICSGKGVGRMLMAGTLLVFLGGTLKALWKLLYAAEIADIQWMSQIQFVLLAFGFLAICVTVIYMVRKSRKPAKGGIVLGMAMWKLPFLFLMTLTSIGAEGILAYISFQRGEKIAGMAFAVGVMGLLAMGSLASADQTLAMQWIEESINTLGNGGFMLGSILLHRSFKKFGCEIPLGGLS
jgi:hypothetical protein